ncbi:hypothetical protein XarbCFBP7697_02635 [Xanthomonas arboricola]|nr:hypothetical protein XarbCFBP7697_02635 [Xanthomonas arboricola]
MTGRHEATFVALGVLGHTPIFCSENEGVTFEVWNVDDGSLRQMLNPIGAVRWITDVEFM